METGSRSNTGVKMEPPSGRSLCLWDMVLTWVVWIFVVAFWRGSWELTEVYFLKGEDYYASWITAPVGATLCVLLTLTKPVLKKLFKEHEESWMFVIFTRFFTYIFACAYIIQWVGVWTLISNYHGKEWKNSLVWCVICFVLAWLFRISSTALRSPYFIRLDARPKFFKVYSRFKCPPMWVICFLLDVMCTHYILLNIIIGLWRGFWYFLEDTVFPNDKAESYATCLVVGVIVLVLLGLPVVQYNMASISQHIEENYHMVLKIIFEDFYHMIIILATIAAWRGLWMIMKEYILSDPLFGGWMCHAGGFFILVVMRTASTIVWKEISVDGSKRDGDGILWRVDYVSFYRRIKKDVDVKINWI